MSISEQINLLISTTCFSKVSTRYSEPKEKFKRSFHDSIKNNKDHIFNLYSQHTFYKDMMPVISKSKRGNYYYNKMFKLNPKQKRKSAFFEGLMKAIEDIEKRKKKAKYSEENKLTFRKLYAKSKLELLKERKEKYESYLSKKNKTLTNINNNINNNTNINNNINNIKPLRKSKSMIDQIKHEYKSASEKIVLKSFNNRNKTRTDNFTNVSNLNEQNITIETLQTFNQNNESSRKSINKNLTKLDLAKLSLTSPPKKTFNSISNTLSRKSVDLSAFFQKKERFMYQNTKRMKKILNKCEENIAEAQIANESIEQYSKIKDPLSLVNKFKNAMQTYDQKVIEDIDKGSKTYQEYKRIQEQKFKTLKKNIDLKVSDKYAYMIRNELQDTFGVNGDNIVAYGLYQKDMEKIKNKVENNLQNENNNITKVNDLLDNVIRKKEFLKYLINTYKMKQDKFNEVKDENIKKKDDFEDRDYNTENLKGTFLPKILEMRDQCYGMNYELNK